MQHSIYKSSSGDLQFVDRMTAHLTRDMKLARTAEVNTLLSALKSFATVLMTEPEDQLND